MTYPRGIPGRRLSPREVLVLRLLLAGMTQAAIDRQMQAKTSRIHVMRVKEKFQLTHMPIEQLIWRLRLKLEGD